MRTTLSINQTLLRRAKHQATQSGVTLGCYVEEALRQRLAKPVTSPARPVKLPTVDGGGVRAGIDPSSNRLIFELLDEQDAAK